MASAFTKLGCVVAALVTSACGGSDAGDGIDAGANIVDATVALDAPNLDAEGADAQPSIPDASGPRLTLLPGFCPSSVTAPGLYEGSLAANLNDVSGCDGSISAPGRDGSVRVELAPGASVSATLRHAGDGAIYILDACPVTSTCLDSSDQSLSGAETVSYTNDSGAANTVYVVLDSDSLAGAQAFELDLAVD